MVNQAVEKQRYPFELRVLQQGENCILLLLWNQRSQHLSVPLPESAQLTQHYDLWRKRYFRFYELSSAAPVSSSGRLNPGSSDPAHDLMEAEQALIQSFRRWLGEGEGRVIQQKIRDQLTRLMHAGGPAAAVGIDVFVACESADLARLPWEQWDLAPEGTPADTIRIFRSAPQREQAGAIIGRSRRHRKTRILAILADDPTLALQTDWQVLRSLRSVAEVQRLTWSPEDTVAAVKTKITATLKDDRGWDVLYFGGHSDDTAISGGQFALSANIQLSLSETEEALAEARQNGLQLALFNSCNGLSIAQSLAGLGIQALVMREPVASAPAHRFLSPFCQQLAQGLDVGEALAIAQRSLAETERFAYPSAHLVSSLFLAPGSTPYRIQPSDWRQGVRQWVLTRKDLTLIALVSVICLIQPLRIGVLLDTRLLLQAVYRYYTQPLPPEDLPPVALISVDQTSLNRASENMPGFQFADPHEIDREYLSGLIRKLSSFGAKTMGISYLLYTEEPQEVLLADSIQAAVAQGTWFVFASDTEDELFVRDRIASDHWSFNGDQRFYPWELDLPQDGTCAQDCTFSYLLALSAAIENYAPFQQTFQPDPGRSQNLQTELSFHLRTWQQQSDTAVSQLVQWANRGRQRWAMGGDRRRQYIIDTSLPPDHVYETIPAHKLLSDQFPPDYFADRVVIIAPGDYSAEEDFFSVPLSHDFFGCLLKQYPCQHFITRGELQAYNVHHLLTQYRAWKVSDWWVIGLAIGLAKALSIRFISLEEKQRSRGLYRLAAASVLYALGMVQLFTSTATLVPIALPLLTIWLLVLSAIRGDRKIKPINSNLNR
ncbi:MAG: CHASE2 domain-containing protein [Cyanobacteria bacterium J06635_15]